MIFLYAVYQRLTLFTSPVPKFLAMPLFSGKVADGFLSPADDTETKSGFPSVAEEAC